MKLYDLLGKNKYAYAILLNKREPFQIEFTYESSHTSRLKPIGDFISIVKTPVKIVNGQFEIIPGIDDLNAFTPIFSQKAFDCLQGFFLPEPEKITKIYFENHIFYAVKPTLLSFSNKNDDWNSMVQELPEDAYFFNYSIYAYGAVVTEEFKKTCEKNKLKSIAFRLRYDSEAQT
ncbi:hypothetical protein COW36_04720 [bacterium (Candidatus Blackallbacteria) CG17_big_fil_post_rev_8_21_14_2_50_48_46]|uniref:Uncharacterized protein n=1 Tax=bacterium (Candidatus Blackallbacteria) CG17_big_fil_post_rev_8_21_14_2_50_48_46 TaxID=2014261 RepID=A0A2M7G911_9BACT|nr:MAG: hypothetical protein COW64_04225 [bacterium (Candidatus Blackallbacteria) CG18_big_fil_WC_8_21_14_2_50_49_26]PIW18598.1 MAG: hypothetical protein COW36_04720 [bacterium (Candidatus Blackallbacteria) CG17_big_fil_post_rev_8_21_14_2_50_48_46]PIW46416.1 MAG: hypothetical protein COW20_15960 [bacterium (Candidatus Blackallbacteria) CG13_big_fil_rev_8_21_14_2_50_49_14]